MEEQIFYVKAGISESMLLRDDEIWFCQDKMKSFEKFEKAINSTGLLKGAYSVPLSVIHEVSFNESSESVKIKYTNEKGKDKKLNIGFGDVSVSNQFGMYLGQKLKLKQSSTQESHIKPLLMNGLYLLLAIGATLLLGTMDDTTDLLESGNARSRSKGELVKLVVDTIGQTGILVIGGLISLYLAYQMYKRFKNPASEIRFTK